ncbi:hypothetical protein [Spirosoma agri]|uniref:Uncharacterized protein n=1 Tax=Spirosoma agri TaxID=1987381 RepID=A0A6M0IUA8_9BACT|nr:hypothetical protein [Spirosoma agri]NEU70963.1 hypothetical protein [Spirosoma agri]
MAKVLEPAPVVKPSRKRSGPLILDDIIAYKALKGEVFGKMTRIFEKYHEFLREIAYKYRKPMNTILYNPEALDQTYQCE